MLIDKIWHGPIEPDASRGAWRQPGLAETLLAALWASRRCRFDGQIVHHRGTDRRDDEAGWGASSLAEIPERLGADVDHVDLEADIDQ